MSFSHNGNDPVVGIFPPVDRACTQDGVAEANRALANILTEDRVEMV